MYDTLKVKTAFKNLLGWREHHNATDIPLTTELKKTDSNQYYQQKHPILSLENISAILPRDYTLNNYLEELVDDSIVEMLNDVIDRRQLRGYGKTILGKSLLLSKSGWKDDKIVNLDRLVGFSIQLKYMDGLKMVIDEIGLQFDTTQDLTLYLFHSDKKDPIKTVLINTGDANFWKWEVYGEVLKTKEAGQFHEGFFFLGYYQEDLIGNAINYSINWNVGECGTCNGGHSVFNTIRQYYGIFPMHVPKGQYVKGEMFDPQYALYSTDQSFGLNLRLSSYCDLTDFFVENKLSFVNVLSLKVAYKVLNKFKFSIQINHIEEQLKNMVIRELEGDKETNYQNVPRQYSTAIKAIEFNIGSINSLCLEDRDTPTAPSYGVVE